MRQSLKKSLSMLSIVLLPALFLACDDSTSPPVGAAVGNYTAVSFVTTGTSGQRNEILAGSTLVSEPERERNDIRSSSHRGVGRGSGI